ncbi:type II secretion system protein GspD [Hydrogenimonas urashimensis]|uniref:type II secretion system protein GspD n=1 Tax=Hydrogenimonas urashimensis TaxID=2740515 RepID=UPI0019150E8C|nr:secretin N-terminal domain-containing protein [Hydrogenimonas urashimensis]
MKRIFAALMLSALVLFGSVDCQNKLFSFSTGAQNGPITIFDIVRNLADTCEFSVMFSDEEAKRVVRTPLEMVHIHDYTLDEMFSFLFDEHNMFYRYDPQRRILTISYIETKSFHIDYVNLSELKTESIKSITVGASNNNDNYNTYGGGGGYGNTGSGGYGSGYGNENGGDNSDYTTIKTVTEFKFWDNFKEQIDAILQRDEDSHRVRSKSLINKEAGIVTVTGTKRQIERVQEYINHVTGRLHKQIMLEANLIELRYADKNTTGVDWSRFDLKLRGLARKGDAFLLPEGYKLGYQFTMDGLLSFLQRYGDVHTISNPKVMTLNNQPAVINVGDQINYKYQTGAITTTTTGNPVGTNTYTIGSVFVGLTLNIVPEVTDDGFIILKINPVVSEPIRRNEGLDYNPQPEEGDFPSSPLNTDEDSSVRQMPPDVKIKQLTSIVKVKNGHKVVIGGLISKRVINSNTKVPLLGDIPLLGRAFHHTGTEMQKVELIVIITPRIVDGTEVPSIDEALQMEGEER